MSDFCYEILVTARKPHQCDACLKPINAGEKYLRAAGVSQGDFWNSTYHPECREWEIKVNNEALGYFSDEWCALHEHVTECDEVLDDAPQSVRDRFKPAGDPA